MDNFRLLWLFFLVVSLIALIVELLERPRSSGNLVTPIALFASVVIFALLTSGRLNRNK